MCVYNRMKPCFLLERLSRLNPQVGISLSPLDTNVEFSLFSIYKKINENFDFVTNNILT